MAWDRNGRRITSVSQLVADHNSRVRDEHARVYRTLEAEEKRSANGAWNIFALADARMAVKEQEEADVREDEARLRALQIEELEAKLALLRAKR